MFIFILVNQKQPHLFQKLLSTQNKEEEGKQQAGPRYFVGVQKPPKENRIYGKNIIMVSSPKTRNFFDGDKSRYYVKSEHCRRIKPRKPGQKTQKPGEEKKGGRNGESQEKPTQTHLSRMFPPRKTNERSNSEGRLWSSLAP